MTRAYFNLINPVALREMKVRMRGPRPFVLLACYMAMLALVVLTIYLRKGSTSAYSYGGNLLSGNFGPTRNYETGQDIFIAVFLYLLVTVAIVTPALCAGLVSREMEEGTYDMLLVTPVRGRALVNGKLLAVLGYICLLLLAAFPLACIVFMFGGVSFANLLSGYTIVLMECLLLSVISVFFSGLFRRTSLAVVATYCLSSLLLLGVPVLSGSLMTTIYSDPNRNGNSAYQYSARIDPAFDLPKRMLVFNPFAALGSVLAPNAPYRPGNTDELQYFPNSRSFWGNPTSYYATPGFPLNSQQDQNYRLAKLPILPGGLALWQGYVLVYTALSLFFLLLCIGVVKPLPRRPGLKLPFTPTIIIPRFKRPLNPVLAATPPATVIAPERESEPLG